MKKLVSYLLFVSLVVVGCSVENIDDSVENIESFTEKRRSSVQYISFVEEEKETEEEEYIYIPMTVKYKAGTSEKEKQQLRNATYIFHLRKVQPTSCRDVETWHIRYSEIDGPGGDQNTNTDDPAFIDKEWLYKDTNLESAANKIEFNWIGSCENL